MYNWTVRQKVLRSRKAQRIGNNVLCCQYNKQKLYLDGSCICQWHSLMFWLSAVSWLLLCLPFCPMPQQIVTTYHYDTYLSVITRWINCKLYLTYYVLIVRVCQNHLRVSNCRGQGCDNNNNENNLTDMLVNLIY